MKKLILLPILFVAIMLHAQAPFEGTIVMKIMHSYSQEYLNIEPYLFSGVDTIAVSIKGDNIHIHFKQSGLHKIYKDGQLIYYSENLKDGFSIVDHKQDMSGVIEEEKSNETRTMLGQSCSVMKRNILLNMSTIRLDYWLADNKWNISPKALERFHSDLSSHMMTDLGGKLCMKMSAQAYITGATDDVMKYAKESLNQQQREKVFGSTSKEVNEMSLSQIAEIVAIESKPISDEVFQPAADIRIEALVLSAAPSINQKTDEIVRETMKTTLMSNPSFAKKVQKGKINLDEYVDEQLAKIEQRAAQSREIMENSNLPQVKAAREMMEKANMDTQTIGATDEDLSFNMIYGERDRDLQTRNKAWLKEHEKIGQEAVQPVAYDLDEEWDF